MYVNMYVLPNRFATSEILKRNRFFIFYDDLGSEMRSFMDWCLFVCIKGMCFRRSVGETANEKCY